MATYSLQDVVASLSGPGGVLSLGYGVGLADEAITIDALEDKNTMQIGGDGEGQHNLHSGNAGTMTFRLLKTSPSNALLMGLYNLQKQSSSLWGKNIITVRHTVAGDNHVGNQCAFKKKPGVPYQKVGNFMEWAFDCIRIESILGSGY